MLFVEPLPKIVPRRLGFMLQPNSTQASVVAIANVCRLVGNVANDF
jgi:hypothetical protein